MGVDDAPEQGKQSFVLETAGELPHEYFMVDASEVGADIDLRKPGKTMRMVCGAKNRRQGFLSKTTGVSIVQFFGGSDNGIILFQASAIQKDRCLLF